MIQINLEKIMSNLDIHNIHHTKNQEHWTSLGMAITLHKTDNQMCDTNCHTKLAQSQNRIGAWEKYQTKAKMFINMSRNYTQNFRVIGSFLSIS